MKSFLYFVGIIVLFRAVDAVYFKCQDYSFRCNGHLSWGKHPQNHCVRSRVRDYCPRLCGTCQDEPGTASPDVDECAENPLICGKNSNCFNTADSYLCKCKPGFASPAGKENDCSRPLPPSSNGKVSRWTENSATLTGLNRDGYGGFEKCAVRSMKIFHQRRCSGETKFGDAVEKFLKIVPSDQYTITHLKPGCTYSFRAATYFKCGKDGTWSSQVVLNRKLCIESSQLTNFEPTKKCFCGSAVGESTRQCKWWTSSAKDGSCVEQSSSTDSSKCGSASLSMKMKYTSREHPVCKISKVTMPTDCENKHGGGAEGKMSFVAVSSSGAKCELGALNNPGVKDFDKCLVTVFENAMCKVDICLSEDEIFESVAVKLDGNDGWLSDGMSLEFNDKISFFPAPDTKGSLTIDDSPNDKIVFKRDATPCEENELYCPQGVRQIWREHEHLGIKTKGFCAPLKWKCDKVKACIDGSDEQDC